MLRALRKTAAEFNAAKRLPVIGLTLSLLMWLVAFLAVGGEWFLMWQSPTWNGQEAAFRNFVVVGLVLLVLLQPDTDHADVKVQTGRRDCLFSSQGIPGNAGGNICEIDVRNPCMGRIGRQISRSKTAIRIMTMTVKMLTIGDQVRMLAHRPARKGQRERYKRVDGEKAEDGERTEQVVHFRTGAATEGQRSSGSKHQRRGQSNSGSRRLMAFAGALECRRKQARHAPCA